MSTKSRKLVRCAIYTRVSTDQRLEQDFNSLDAQYDASQAYIRSQTTPAGRQSAANMTTGAFPGAIPTGPRCSACWRMSGLARST
jgi:hypothetical protein